MHLLQLSALCCFVGAARIALRLGRPVGAAVLLLNALTSLRVHRCDRTEADGVSDVLDRVAIALWVMYNAHRAASAYPPPHEALVLAALCAVLDGTRRLLPWRCAVRNAVHALMHLAGALGTCALLLRS